MATYEYQCKRCNKRFQTDRTVAEHEKQPKPACPKCKSNKQVEQVPAHVDVITSSKS